MEPKSKIQSIRELERILTTFVASEQKLRSEALEDQRISPDEQAGLDRINGKIAAVRSKLDTQRKQWEANKAAWEARKGDYDRVLSQMDDLRVWEHIDYSDVQTSIFIIQNDVGGDIYVDAPGDLDKAIAAITPLHGEYLKQKDAKEKYENARAELDQLLDKIEICTYSKFSAERKAVLAPRSEIDKAVDAHDWVLALSIIESATAGATLFDQNLKKYEEKLREEINDIWVNGKKELIDFGNSQSPIKSQLATLIASIEGALRGGGDLETALKDAKQVEALVSQLVMDNVRSVIEAADSGKKDEAAMKLFEEYKNKNDLDSLPTEARNLLVENLLSKGGTGIISADEKGEISVDEKKAINEIWASAKKLDPAFTEFDIKRTENMVKTMESDPEMKEYAANWSTMSNTEKQKALKKVTKIIGGESGWELNDVDEIKLAIDGPHCKAKPILRGSHSHKNKQINICMCNNTEEWNPSNDFADVVLNLTHEVGHAYQRQMIERYSRLELKPGDDEYDQAKMLALDRWYFHFFPDDYDVDSMYVHSPMEQQSRITANRVREELPSSFGSGHHNRLEEKPDKKEEKPDKKRPDPPH